MLTTIQFRLKALFTKCLLRSNYVDIFAIYRGKFEAKSNTNVSLNIAPK